MMTLSLGQVTKMTRLVEDDGAQGTSILYGQLQCRVSLLFTCVVTNNTVTEGGTLIRIKTMVGQLAVSHPANGMYEISAIEIFETVLIRIMGVGLTVEVQRQGVLDPVLIMSIL